MSDRDIHLHRWKTGSPDASADLASGSCDGVVATSSGLRIGTAVGEFARHDAQLGTTTTYDAATWTSPLIAPGFAVAELIGSWTATTPGRSWIRVEVRGHIASHGAGHDDHRAETQRVTRWYALADWAADDLEIARTSIPDQTDADGSVDTDTYIAATGREPTSWQLRVTLMRPTGTDVTPIVHTIGAVATGSMPRTPTTETATIDRPATDIPAINGPAAGTSRVTRAVTLAVPTFSQLIHADEYPQWAGGGRSWCSPTAVSMIAAYWGTGPSAEDQAWVEETYPDPWVAHAARHTYDVAFRGCGNWAFNTAYVGRFGLDAFVTRLRSLVEAQSFIDAGIPLVVSAAYAPGEVPGAGKSDSGHLLVLAGFTDDGDPVMNDPDAPDNPSVRKVFGRREFESAWQRTSKGVVYVIRPETVALPPRAAQPNW